MKKVFITRRLPPIASSILRQNFQVDERSENTACPRDELAAALTEYDVVLSTVADRLDREALQHVKKLRVISNYAVGLNNIDLAYAQSLGITVYNTPDVVTNSTADMTLAILLTLIRRIPQAQELVRQGQWKGWDPERCLGEELSGKVFGILGYGRIGQAVAQRAAGFGMHILYFSRGEKKYEDSAGLGRRAGSIDELFATVDYLSIHCPLTDETRNMIDSDAFDKMRKQPVVLNMARGEVIVTADLVEALRSGKIRGAGLDVIAAEQLSRDHVLCQSDNVIVVPHIGTATMECRRDMAVLAARNIVTHFQ